MAQIMKRSCIGTRRMGLAKGKCRSNVFWIRTYERSTSILICLQNEGYPASLELWKVYRVLPDEKAAKHQLLRVIDESGEDYLYSENYFAQINLPQAVEEALLKAS